MSTLDPRRIVLRDESSCVVRAAGEADAEGMIALQRDLAREPVFTTFEPDEFTRDAESQKERIREFERRDNWLMLVAESGARVIGELSFRGGIYRRLAHRGELGISVSADHRGRGLGRAMLGALIDWATAHPVVEKINLCVFANNERAIRLYRSMGFVEQGRREREIRLGAGEYVDDVLMTAFVKTPRPAG